MLPGNIGRVTKKAPVYRLLDDTRNFEEEYDQTWPKPYVGGETNMEDDAGGVVNEDGDSSPFKLDVSQYRPASDSNLYPNRLGKPNRPHVTRLVNGKPGDWNLQDNGKPLTFPLNPDLKPQVNSRDRTGFEPVPQPPSHPYTANRHVIQSGSNAPPNARWVPVVSHRLYGAGSQISDFGATERRDSTSPYSGHPLDNFYGGPLNRPEKYEQERSPASHPVYTQTVPERQGPSFPERNERLAYQPQYDQMYLPPRESIVSTQQSPQRGRKPVIPRYVVQSRNGYQNNRYFGSKLSYDPKVWW